jgi:hypothetical protein
MCQATMPSSRVEDLGGSCFYRDTAPAALSLAERKRIVGQTNRVLLSSDKNRYHVPRLRRTLSSLD